MKFLFFPGSVPSVLLIVMANDTTQSSNVEQEERRGDDTAVSLQAFEAGQICFPENAKKKLGTLDISMFAEPEFIREIFSSIKTEASAENKNHKILSSDGK